MLRFVAASVLLACADSSSDAAVEVQDSAGIRTVTNRAPASTDRWKVDPQPAVEIGANEDDTTQMLFRVASALLLEDGGIAVAQGPAPMIRWFTADGVYRFGAGRPGGGPGEFGPGEGARISAFWPLAGDSVATWEHAARRMQVFGPDGRFARAVVLDLPPNMPAGSYPQVLGRLDSGFVTFLPPLSTPGTVGEVKRPPVTYLRYRNDGSYAGELARLPGFTSFTMVVRPPGGVEQRVTGRPPFAKIPAAWSSGDSFVYGSNDSYEIVIFDTTGAPRTIVRKATAPRPVTADVIEAHKKVTMEGAPPDPAMRRQWQESIDSAPYPSSLPAYRRLRVDRTGMLWVQEYELPGADSVTWSIFDPGGRWLSDVITPADWQVLDIGEDYLLVLYRDELDVERVRKHALQRGED